MSPDHSERESSSTSEQPSPDEVLRHDLIRFHMELGRKYGISDDKLNDYAREATDKAIHETDKASRYDRKFEVLNSKGLEEELNLAVELAKRYNLPISAAFVDLRGLKAINEHPSLGQDSGDKAIKVAIDAIKSCLRKSDITGKTPQEELAMNGQLISEIVAREGGDEFVILFLGTPLDGSVVATQRALEAISKESDLKMPEHRQIFGRPLSGRAGIAQFDPGADQDGTNFLKRIGGAMYITKKREARLGVSAPIYKDNDYHTVIVRQLKPNRP